MEYKTKKNENASVRITIKTSAEEVEEAYQTAYARARKQLKLPGFRKGKVPPELAQKHLGETVSGEAARHLVSESFRSIVEDLDPPPISMPSFEVESIDRTKGAVFHGYYDTHPEIKIGRYRKVKTVEDRIQVGTGAVEGKLKELQQSQGLVKSREKEEPLQSGDQVTMDIRVLQGEKVVFKSKEQKMNLPGDEFIPGIGEQLIGARIEEQKSFETTFPEVYPNPEMAGEKVRIELSILEGQYQELPELNDDFAREVSNAQTLDALKERLKGEIEAHGQNVLRQRARRMVLESIIEDSKFIIPNSLIEKEMDRRLESIRNRLGAPDLDLNALARRLGEKPETLEQEMRDASVKTIKEDLILMEVSEKENITCSAEEMEQEVRQKYGNMMTDKQLEEWLQKESFRENMQHSLVYRKTLDWLYENAEIKKGNEIPYEKLMEADDYYSAGN